MAPTSPRFERPREALRSAARLPWLGLLLGALALGCGALALGCSDGGGSTDGPSDADAAPETGAPDGTGPDADASGGGGADAETTPGGDAGSDAEVDAGDPCEGVVCDEPPSPCHEATGTCEGGECSYAPISGEPCDDGDPCTVDDTCQEGTCEGEPKSCDSPPGPCYEAEGTCDDGSCNYDFANGQSCDDGDPCTTDDTCQGGTCSGGDPVLCNTPPANECLDDDTLRSYESTGTCQGGDCSYASTEVDCPFGCQAGSCLGDPCANLTCDDPPGPCYEPVGTCSGGQCSYEPDDGASCDDGDPCTTDDTCQDGVCQGTPKACEDPPADACVGDGTLRSYASPGTCQDGECSYGSTEVDCPYGCEEGSCATDPCEGVTCDEPPSPCHAPEGFCEGGSCSYPFLEGKPCDDGDPCTADDTCTNGGCQGDPVACDEPPEPGCVDDTTLETWSDSGTCDGGTCSYDSSTTTCEVACEDGACQGDPCGGVTCDDPPADECVGEDTLRTYDGEGTCSDGTCDYPAEDRPCPAGCADGACTMPTGMAISEVRYDAEGADGDGDVFVELHGPAGQSVDGLILAGVDGDDGETYASIELSGSLDAQGLFLLTTPNASEALTEAAQQLDEAADLQNGPDNVVLRFQGEAIDALGYGDFGDEHVFAGEGPPAPAAPAGHALTRDSAYTDTDDNASDFTVVEAPTPGAPNLPPSAALDCPADAGVGETVLFDASASADPDGSISTYTFDFGDGSDPVSGSSATVNHFFDETGTYEVELTVEDDAGLTATASCEVPVLE